MIISKWLIFDIPGKIAMQDCGDYMPAFLYTGYIISPNYPYNYSSPLFCSWSVGSGQNGTAIVKVIDFNLRPRVEGVCSDSVSFSFGVEPDFRGLPYCGRTYPQNVYFQSRNIHIIFTTQRGSPGNYTGFKMSYSLYVNQNNTVFTYQDPISNPIREISLNNQSLRITGRNKIQLTCGYKNLPVLNGTKFQWYLNNQTLGPVISPSQPTFNHSNFYRLQLITYTSGIASGSENFIWYRSQIPIVSGANSNVQIERQGSESILTLRNIQRQSSNTSLTHFTCSYDGVMGIKEAHHTIEIFPAQPQPSTCPKQQQNDFSWPETPVDAVAVIPCGQLSSGNVTRACLLDTVEQLPRWGSVSSINCVSQPFISIQQQASNLTDKNNNATEVLTRLQNITNTPSNQSLTGGDILVANSILEKVANISDELSIQIKDLYEFVRTGSNLIEKKNRDQWIEIQKTKPGTTELAQNLDRYGSLVGLSNETIIVAADNIGYDVSTTIKIVSFIYKTLNELLPEQVDQTLKTNSSRWIPQTVVISTSLYPPLNKKLLEPIDYTLQKVSNSELLFNRELYKVTDEFNCSFWNYTIKFLKNPTNKIHMNLFAWLLVANLIIMFVDLAKHIKVLCTILASVLHFSLLATFMWMLVEGIHIYLVLIKVFDVNEKFLYYQLASIGVPALIAGLTAAITCGAAGMEYYLSSQGCWLSATNWVILAFVIPFVIIFVGLYIFLAYCAFSQKVKEAYGKYKKQGKRHFIMKEKPSNTKEKSNDSSYPSSKVGNVKTEKTSIITSTDVEKSVNVTSAEQMKQENINPESCEENFVVLSVPEVSVLPETNDSLADTDSRADSELDQKPLSGGDPIERKNEEEVLKKQSYSDQENLSLEDQQELLRIKIRGLHPQASTDEIREYFKRYGKIERIGSISKHQANQSDDENEDTVETYVVYHEKSAIDSIFSETKDTHIIHDRQVYLQL
ncbi:uncharacterized protein TRIADDRAFT_55944 [Trichoplax adhaerens]|uniref:Uncharacterized protein n=1 Tax=Trichoplax adhaerens TaxID=10228 RepID=B3RTJ2_TRIAD|nr:hypothetical protein TRIADDRAFT_55944 [Trichoplax adhaerens]EDV25639.1 hypothetical protein TRIADDRAFT_55944 [Trichoplax adhaerens]|eukprot:XP_002111672.1 hypothetical protein TRIADDRAFT_55944 [Trichoplax adhaerens]